MFPWTFFGLTYCRQKRQEERRSHRAKESSRTIETTVASRLVSSNDIVISGRKINLVSVASNWLESTPANNNFTVTNSHVN